MGGDFGGLVFDMGKIGCVLTYFCAVGVNGVYVDMSICIICWLS